MKSRGSLRTVLSGKTVMNWTTTLNSQNCLNGDNFRGKFAVSWWRYKLVVVAFFRTTLPLRACLRIFHIQFGAILYTSCLPSAYFLRATNYIRNETSVNTSISSHSHLCTWFCALVCEQERSYFCRVIRIAPYPISEEVNNYSLVLTEEKRSVGSLVSIEITQFPI